MMTPFDKDESKSVATTSGRVGYRIGGAGQTVLFIASTGRCCTELWPLAHALQGHGFRTILAEPRGIAPSIGPMEGITFHDFAADFAAVLRAELTSGERAIVAGHAYGVWIARTLAQDAPDLVAGLALLAPGARNWPGHLSDAISAINDESAAKEDRLAALKLGFFADGNDPAEWLTGWHRAVVASQRAARAATPPEEWRPSGSAPILDLRGAEDPFRPRGTENELVEELGSRVMSQSIAGTSHAMPVERPDAVAAAIASWWVGIT